MGRKVVVTGLGVVSPLGLDVESSWSNLVSGKSGISTIGDDDPSFDGLDVKICGKVKGFDAAVYINPKDIKKMGVFIQYGIAASHQALKDAGLFENVQNPERFGVAVGSGIGGLEVIGQNYEKLIKSGPRRVSPFFIPASIVNMVAGQISILYGLQGPNVSTVTACTTGTHNIAQAHRFIAYGDADVMLAGGSEMASIPLGIAGFAAAKTLSKRNDSPEAASRPWDKGRDGFVLGEGGAVMVLESEEHAKARGAKIYAELSGCGFSSDAYHMTSPSGDGAVRSMNAAIHDAGISPSEIAYVNAHATSTVAGDLVEIDSARKVFGDHVSKIAMSSTKSMTGHLLGAAGSLEAVFSILAIRDQVCPPTINLDEPDEGCDINLVAHEAQSQVIQHVLSNSFGFGGTNGSLIFSKFDG